MNKKIYYKIVATAFLAIAFLHFLRAVYQWEAVIQGVVVPVWISWVVVFLAGYLAVRAIQFAKK